MGRRSINTTKSGKYMNPTDQARKEARKQELKKNKKQRQLVRAAVLKGKDPHQILDELEKIDQMEFNVVQPSPLNEKVLKDKRKKLRETLDRVLSMYYKDDPEKWADLKRKQTEYEHKRSELVHFYESVKSAQQVTVDEIPLPQLPQQQQQQNPLQQSQMPGSIVSGGVPSAALMHIMHQIPIPTTLELKKPEHMIYSIATALKIQSMGHQLREPPGCPVGPPPDIDSDGEPEERYKPTLPSLGESRFIGPAIAPPGEEPPGTLNIADLDESKNSDSQIRKEELGNRPSTLLQKMVALSGQNVDDFMKEMEEVANKKKIAEQSDKSTVDKQQRSTAASIHIESPAPPGTENLDEQRPSTRLPPNFVPPPPPPTNIRLPPGPPPGRPPLLPPGPPPGLPPQHRQGGPPLSAVPPPQQQAPPPPPLLVGAPPPGMSIAAVAAVNQQTRPLFRLPGMSLAPPPPGIVAPPPPGVSGHNPNVLSAAPQLIHHRTDLTSSTTAPHSTALSLSGSTDRKPSATTISAKPQIRNLSADVTRFVPSALRVKRGELGDSKLSITKRTSRSALLQEMKRKDLLIQHQMAQQEHRKATKDDAYMQFMKEMQGLL